MTLNNCKELDRCLCCGSKNLRLILDLGNHPMANSYKESPGDEELRFPLKLNLCANCTHLQLSHAVDPDLLFKNYLYVSGTSKTLRDYFDWFAKFTLDYFTGKANSVLDIACNDGSQLNSFKALGLKTYGIDPATNLYASSSANHSVVCDYFTDEYIDRFKEYKLDIITAQNVFAHNSYPLEFLETCREIMNDNSVLFVQTSQADMVMNNEFDTIYHEHLSFFNAASMNALVTRSGLHLVDIVKTPIHGNSYVFVIKKSVEDTTKVDDVLAQERRQGLQNLQTYTEYAEKCKNVVNDLVYNLTQYKKQGFLLVGYGAAAKGMTLLNFANIELDFIIDDNPLKQGLYSPGMNIPILPKEALEDYEDFNIAFVPLAWNFFDEIKRNVKTMRDRSDDVFIRYFPKINIE